MIHQGIDAARWTVDGWARHIADQIERCEEPSTYALDAYRDAKTDLRDMYALLDDLIAMRQAVAS